MGEQSFWDSPDEAEQVSREHSALTKDIAASASLDQAREDFEVLLELADEDPSLAPELEDALQDFLRKLDAYELRVYLSGEHDEGNAILSIHPGAGGTDSADWAEMLLRMYVRWVERSDYKLEVIEISPAEEAGIKSATLGVRGHLAFGYLKCERGIHRLVRLSPFDANHRRHTSFASVFVFPEIDDDVEVDIDEKDLRIDTYRSSGAGGQHVNTTDSAVRITHLPTGIVVQCQNERSQHKNRATAMKVLRARLYEHYRREKEEEFAKLTGEKKEIAWGNQIRSYVLHPYQMVKDHRTDVETGSVDSVLDGDIDRFIEAYLHQYGADLD